MKSIQMIIYTFFILRGVMNEDSTIQEVFMVNARNKLKVYKGPHVICPFNEDKKNKYKRNKFLSVKYTEKMIEEEDKQWNEIFQLSKKKDDLADSYLQGNLDGMRIWNYARTQSQIQTYMSAQPIENEEGLSYD